MSKQFFYNRQKAVEYANIYSFSRNPKYYDFSNLGGNCTNFVSQCLHAGGCPFNFEYPLGWFYKSINNRSPSFTGVEFLYNFLVRQDKSTGPKAVLAPIEHLDIGDIIQLSFDEIKFSHTLIVTKVNHQNPSNPYCATNTFDAFDRQLSSYNYFIARGLKVS